MPQPVEIQTERLRIWLPPASAAPAVLRYFEQNQAHLEPWEPDRPEAFYSLPFWEKRLTDNREEVEQGCSLRLFLEARSETDAPIVGAVSFTNVIRGAFRACHLGYSLDGRRQGQGLMYEALRAVLPVAFHRLELHRVMANYQPQNERSGRLLARLAFEREGYAKDYLYIHGAWRDHVLTALVLDR